MVARVTAEYAGLEGDWKGLEMIGIRKLSLDTHWDHIESFWILADVR